MSTTGDLEQFPFSEFLSSLASLSKSGRLTLSRYDERGLVLLREGRIVHAATSSLRETLGSLLVGERLVTEDELARALDIQRTSDREQRLGNILVDLELLHHQDLERIITQQTQRVIVELMQWKHGFFEFEAMEIEDHGEIATSVSGLLLREGLIAEGLLLTASYELDRLAMTEGLMEAAPASDAVADDDSTDPAFQAPVEEAVGGGKPDQLSSLRSLMFEIRSPEFTGELTGKIMDFASRIFTRSILFSVKGENFCGMGSFGIGFQEKQPTAAHQIRIPVGEKSILAKAVAMQTAYQGRLQPEVWNQRLIRYLGGDPPREAVAVPVIVDSRVVLVLYGDTAPENAPIESVAALELLAQQVGLAMEKGVVDRPPEVAVPEAPTDASSLSSEVLRELVDVDPEPVIVVNADGEVHYVNQSMAATLGASSPELLGQDLTTLVHADDANDLSEFLQEVAQGATPGATTVRFSTSDGAWRAFYLLASAVGSRPEDRSVMLRPATTNQAQHRHDALTGLLDREAMLERVAKTLERAKVEDDWSFAVLVLDIDRFKLVNASMGWQAGNELLCAVANRLAQYLRPSDVQARLEGNQFCVLLDRLGESRDATLVARRIIDFLSPTFNIADRQVSITVSIGIAVNHEDYGDAGEMLFDAESAARSAKADPGNSTRMSESAPGRSGKTAVARLRLENEMRLGIDRGEFVPHYQPILNMSTGQVVSFELLARWEHPERGLLEPAEFLSVAEETGLIVPMAKSLLLDGCVQLRRWHDRLDPDRRPALGMNITTAHLRESEILNTVDTVLDMAGLEGSHLIVEITESLLMEQMDTVVQILNVLKELRVRVYVDDFGMGYSSLSHLHMLPVDGIKVDRSFVARIGSDQGSGMIVRTIIDLAHNLGQVAVGEGIEDPEQLRLLRELGCDLGQGFLFSRPKTAEQCETLLFSEPGWSPLFPASDN